MTRRTRAFELGLVCTLALPSTAHAGERMWVRFVDKGPAAQGDALPRALAARQAELPARTLARRQRTRGPLAVDARDLPVWPDHVARVQATGARVHVQSRWLNAVSVEATPAQLAQIARLPEVSRVTPVAHGQREPSPALGASPLPGEPGMDEFGLAYPQLDLIGATTLQQQCGLTGAGVVVGVQDSGFDLDHQALAGLTVLAAHDFIDDDDDVGTEPGNPDQQANHGTRVLAMLAGSDPGTFMGVAPGISVVLSKTEDVASETPIEEDDYVAGLEWIELQGADVFTASLGYFSWYEYADFDGQTAVSSIAVDAAFDNGLVVVASLGNGGPAPMTLIAPADAAGAIGIGAVDLAGVVAGFSSRGPTADGRIKPDVAAPGAGTTSVEFGTTDQYGGFNGTSAAAPMAAGLVALLLEARPTLTAQQMLELVHGTSSQAATPDNDLGYGVLDGRLASGDACGCNDSDADGHVGVLCGGDDCSDGVAAAYPGAEEICDGVDDDCDGQPAPDEVDADGDGVLLCAGDCDDQDPQVAPGLAELCGDGLDNDCLAGDEPCPATTSGSEGSTGGAASSEEGSGAQGSGTGPLAPGESTATLDGHDSSGFDTDTTPAEEGEADGCACTTTPSPARGWSLLVLLAVLRRRRRAAAGSAALATLVLAACGDSGAADQGQDTGTTQSDPTTSIAPVEGCELPVEIPQLDVTPSTSTGFVRCNDGSIYRVEPVTCAQPLPTGTACNVEGGECEVDADCNGAPNGACLYMAGFFSGCECEYGCTTDADCAEGQICACGGSAPGYPPSTRCIAAGCTGNDACPGSTCGLAHEVNACGEAWSTACRTPEDACVRRQDCPGEDDNCLPAEDGAWACATPGVC